MAWPNFVLHSRPSWQKLPESDEVFPSGLDLLRKRRPRLSTDPDRFIATRHTWEQWSGVDELQAWKGLALHFRLDPGALDPAISNRAYRSAFLEQVGMFSDHPVAVFWIKLVWLADDIRSGRLGCAEICRDPIASIVTVDEFARYIRGASLRRPMLFPDESIDLNPQELPIWGGMKHVTPLMAEMAEMAKLWRLVPEGGTVVDGDPSTYPDVEGILLERGRVKPYLCRDIARILGDGFLSPGPRPHAPQVEPNS